MSSRLWEGGHLGKAHLAGPDMLSLQVLVSAQVCRIDNNSNNLVPVDNVQVSCTYHDRARQHEVKLRILDGNEKQSYSLQILGTTHIDSNTQMKNCLLEYNLDIA